MQPSANIPEFSEICDREQRRLASGQDIGVIYTGPGAKQLVERLNELSSDNGGIGYLDRINVTMAHDCGHLYVRHEVYMDNSIFVKR